LRRPAGVAPLLPIVTTGKCVGWNTGIERNVNNSVIKLTLLLQHKRFFHPLEYIATLTFNQNIFQL
jgi:hypothetical protein